MKLQQESAKSIKKQKHFFTQMQYSHAVQITNNFNKACLLKYVLIICKLSKHKIK